MLTFLLRAPGGRIPVASVCDFPRVFLYGYEFFAQDCFSVNIFIPGRYIAFANISRQLVGSLYIAYNDILSVLTAS